MIFAIDAGNTNILLGCMDGREIVFTAQFGTDREKTTDEYAAMIRSVCAINHVEIDQVEDGIISSVVPVLRPVLQYAVEKLIGKKPLLVGAGLKTGLNIKIDNPAQLGSDMVVDAVAACAAFPKPILIFDLGTATTLSVINAAGSYIGGMIIPGVRLAVDALAARGAQLQNISLDEAPEQLIGTNTINCMKSGAIYGAAAMLDGIIDRVVEDLGEPATVVATGGMIDCVVPYCKRKIICDENLMLRGLQILHEKNRRG